MADTPNSHTSKILYSCYFNRSREGEQFVPEHVFSFQLAGTLTVNDGKKSYLFNEGDFRLSRRNRLAKFIKQPPLNGEFKSVSIYLDQQTLRSLSEELKIRVEPHVAGGDAIIPLKDHNLYKSYIDSLFVYFQLPENEQRVIMDLKVKEAIHLLLKVNPEVAAILFDFSEPYKIELEAFMEKNYLFNVPLERFAYLTGRSLSTFKRDFKKTFNTTPSRWLVQKRLQEAHYLMHQQGKAPSDVYLEVGFENLSHFSFAFKKQYGFAPTQIKY